VARNRNRSVFSQSSSGSAGGRLVRVLLALVLIALVGGAAFLGFADLQPAPTMVEKVIPDSRLPR
jgi:hypothetical protein